jgi:ApaG protein
MSDSRYQVDVSVVTHYLADQSQPEHDRFAFAYTITVQNNGEMPATPDVAALGDHRR